MAEANRTRCLGIALLVVGIIALTGRLSAQEVKHLNPVIEKLAAGKPFIGYSSAYGLIGLPITDALFS